MVTSLTHRGNTMRTREQLDAMLKEAFLVVVDGEDYMVDGYSPEDRVLYTHTVELCEDVLFDFDDIDDTALIYRLELMNPSEK